MLGYQLNPHFLFNTLNSIRALINEDGRRARDMVTALSGYLRYALVERPLHVALLEEEVASVRGYLAIEQVRFEERLDVRLEIEPAALRCEVPAFLLNPLVENAVRHGVPGTADAPLAVRVEARLVAPDRLRLVVENTGHWKKRGNRAGAGEGDDGLPGGVGLANVRARLAAIHPGEHRVGMEHGCGRVRLLVDDERLARFELRTLLEEAHAKQVQVVGEAASVSNAARLVHATDADVVFLDIQLAGETGMDLLPLLGVDVDVVFVTAYDEYTLRAFGVNALDYLLKPVAPERLAVTVNRLAAAQPPAPARETVGYEDRLFLRLGQERVFVRVRDIVAIAAEGDGSTLRLAPHLVPKASTKSLREWEQRLPDRQFVRIHRSSIVNLEHVERLEPWSHASQHVYLRGLPEPVTMSRRFGARLRDRFG